MDGEIHVDELQSLLDEDDDVEIVDIRASSAFERGHIPGSRNIPFPQLVDRVDELDDDPERIVTVCPHGKSSVQAARLIQSYEGIEETPVESLAEGLTGWDGPIETSDAPADPDAPF
ncbi:rhodanese-like domain-containing protein [Halapricum salinum]|mgnify:FL=1|uniref:Rhodanese-like domain-containing protein n=1 Tax=Halapricum salinum TaxID=1457250 RepID=A0A4D6HCV5_9EURY|nr:rhodanese-like domain-containing protein [Halapricum salinum]QCC51640.1 rhodanese-like domain-containing protein [Halapricum salinum]